MMSIKSYTAKALLFGAFFGFVACSDDEEKVQLRDKIDYVTLTDDEAPAYTDFFLDEAGQETVDTIEGNTRLKMFQALNYASSSKIAANSHIDAAVLKNQFSNTGSPFVDISTASISVVGEHLNESEFQLKNVVATSKSSVEEEQVRQYIEDLFEQIEEASHAFEREDNTASNGVAGKVGNYLVDERGIEIIQVIQKSLIGALQLDYIGNHLLGDGLTANNTKLVEGKNYTALEHNWDVAYTMLTLKKVYLSGYTKEAAPESSKREFAGGAYMWEYRRDNFQNIYPAFMKGRAAIVNNDISEVKKQAKIIRNEFELAIANAALGYLTKWKNGATEADRVHAIGEGLGFIYSLRFAKLHDVDTEFSDQLIEDLIGSENGYWDLTTEKVTAAENAIKEKFKM